MTAEPRPDSTSRRPCSEPWCGNSAQAGRTKCAEHIDPRIAEIAASHRGPRPGPRPVPPPGAAGPLEQLLERGSACPAARIKRAAGKADAAIAALRELLDAFEEQQRADAERTREQERAAREVEAARVALEAATAKAAQLGVRLARPKPPAASGAQARAVRAWAAEQGLTCPARGVVPRAITAKFEEAHR